MKKLISIIFIIVISLTLIGCDNKEMTDALKFKQEYESLNEEKNSQGTPYRVLSIDEENPFVYTTPAEIVKKIENNETFYVYFGSTSCPWCRSVIEKAIEVAKNNNVTTIYYIDIWDENRNEILRDKYKINDNGEVELVSEGTSEYYKLLEYFDSLLKEYTLVDSNGETVSVGEKRIFAPNYIYVEKGKAVKLENGVSEYQTDYAMEFTEEILNDEEKKFDEFFSNVDGACYIGNEC